MNYDLATEYLPELHRWAIKVEGEIDIFNSPAFKDALLNLFEEKQADMYFDCSNLDYIDSTALGIFVTVLKRLKENGYGIYLENVRPNLYKLFKITNLDKVFIVEGENNDK